MARSDGLENMQSNMHTAKTRQQQQKKKKKRILVFQSPPMRTSDNHLSNSLTTQRLTTHEVLVLQGGQRIKYGRDQEEDGRNDQRTPPIDQTEPLQHAHDDVDDGPHRGRGESTDKRVELFRRWAYPQQEGYFNKDDDDRGYSAGSSVSQ